MSPQTSSPVCNCWGSKVGGHKLICSVPSCFGYFRLPLGCCNSFVKAATDPQQYWSAKRSLCKYFEAKANLLIFYCLSWYRQIDLSHLVARSRQPSQLQMIKWYLVLGQKSSALKVRGQPFFRRVGSVSILFAQQLVLKLVNERCQVLYLLLASVNFHGIRVLLIETLLSLRHFYWLCLLW